MGVEKLHDDPVTPEYGRFILGDWLKEALMRRCFGFRPEFLIVV
jgi:hypothetical protein